MAAESVVYIERFLLSIAGSSRPNTDTTEISQWTSCIRMMSFNDKAYCISTLIYFSSLLYLTRENPNVINDRTPWSYVIIIAKSKARSC